MCSLLSTATLLPHYCSEITSLWFCPLLPPLTTHTHRHIPTHTYTNRHTCIHIHTDTCIHTCTHTHMSPPAPKCHHPFRAQAPFTLCPAFLSILWPVIIPSGFNLLPVSTLRGPPTPALVSSQNMKSQLKLNVLKS